MIKIKHIGLSVLIIGLIGCSSDSNGDDLAENQPPINQPVTPPNSTSLPAGFKQGVSLVSAITQGPPVGQKWELFNELTDEFDAAELDETKWFGTHPVWSGRSPSQFKKGNAFLDGSGMLKLRSTVAKDPSTVTDPFKDNWVNAAACVSKTKVAKFGYYYETSFKASSLSMTSSYWFRIGKFSEIDVIEHVGDSQNAGLNQFYAAQYKANTHYYGRDEFFNIDANGNRSLKQEFRPLPDETRISPRGNEAFHVYGFWWKSPTELLFYHNNRQVMKITPRVPFDENLNMIFDTEVFPFKNGNTGEPIFGLPTVESLNDNTKNTMLVDYVRVYKKSEEVTPDSGLLKNGSFEVDRLKDWLFNGSVDLATKTTTDLVDGVISVSLKNKGAIAQPISLQEDKTYVVSFSAKGKGNVSVLGNGTLKEIDSSAWAITTLEFTSDEMIDTNLLIESDVNSELVVDNFKLVMK